ncbi:hypothetical protein HDF11_002975 [Tunturiibacter psychrotolerans]
MNLTALNQSLHRTKCDGTKQPHMKSRPGRVKSPSMRISGATLNRLEKVEARHILESNTNAGSKLMRLQEDLPLMFAESPKKIVIE